MRSKQNKTGGSPGVKAKKGKRDFPEGDSVLIKSKGNLTDISSHTDRLTKADKRKAMHQAPDVSSLFDQTPASLSQISSIMPDESLMCSKYPSPTKKRRPAPDIDTTMERAVMMARGEPDGADMSFRPSPKGKKGKKLQLEEIPEVSSSFTDAESASASTSGSGKENSTLMVQKKAKCIKIPLKEAGKKLKSIKAMGIKGKTVSTKVKKNFDRTLPNETMVPKKPKQSWKEKKKERKMVRNNYQLISTAKGLWEDLRRQNLPEEKRQQLCRDLFSKVEGKIKELAVVHDSARVIQCLVQYGSPEYRTAILEEIKPYVAELTKNKYAKFIIKKLMKYGTKTERATIIKGYHGCVRKLIRHKEAAEIVDYAYNEYATSAQRLFFLEEFYGPAFTMFKTQATKSLDDVLAEQPDKKNMIMHNLKESLLPLIDKQILAMVMVHKIFFDFFRFADDKMKKDMIEALRESLIHMVHTKDGVRAAMACVWGGSAKDRKLIVKSLKTHVTKICMNEAGHMLLLAIFDCVDDTVLVQKAILDELLQHLGQLIHDVNGRKVLAYLLVRRDQLFFCPDVTQVLEQGDGNTTSKKDPMVRAQELRDHMSEPLLNYLTEHAAELLSNNHTSLIVPHILAHASGNTGAAMDAVAQTVVSSCDPSYTDGPDGKKLSLVEDPASHITIKKILALDKQLMHQGKDALFSVAMLNAADASTYKAWVASNRGCFILVQLLEVENAQVTQMLVTQLAPLKKYLKKMTFKGADILLRKLDGETGIKKSKKPLEISC